MKTGLSEIDHEHPNRRLRTLIGQNHHWFWRRGLVVLSIATVTGFEYSALASWNSWNDCPRLSPYIWKYHLGSAVVSPRLSPRA
jgi:hypothetical protein